MTQELNQLIQYERFVFTEILSDDRILRIVRSKYASLVCDSFAVRAYSPFKRSVQTDIDFVFPPQTKPSVVVDFILQIFPDRKHFKRVNSNCAFIRIYCPVPIELEFGNEFILDFHIGGYYYNKDMLFNIHNEFFDGYALQTIESIGGLESVRLPVPNIDELFIFKAIKGIGNDGIDLMSLILSENLSMEYLSNRLKDANLRNRKPHNSLIHLFQEFESEVLRWNKYHFSAMKKNDQMNVKNFLGELLGLINE